MAIKIKVFLAMVALGKNVVYTHIKSSGLIFVTKQVGTLQCLKAQATTNDIYEQVKLWYFYG